MLNEIIMVIVMFLFLLAVIPLLVAIIFFDAKDFKHIKKLYSLMMRRGG